MMKKILSLLFALSAVSYLYAQEKAPQLDISLIHNWTGIGRDVELGADVYLGKNIFHFGLSIFGNDALPGLREGHINSRASSFIEKIGGSIAYKRSVKMKDSHLELLPKFEVKVFNLGGVTRWGETYEFFEKRVTINNAIGLDGKVKLYKALYLTGGAEGGVILEENPGSSITLMNSAITLEGFDWTITGNLSIGILYRFYDKS